jgi:hypothetical protein
MPTEYFVLADFRLAGAVIGHLGGHPIREMVTDRGGRR